jgi:hypothetical protein
VTCMAQRNVEVLSAPSYVFMVCCLINYVHLSLSLWFYRTSDLGLFFSFLILYTVGRTPWTGDQTVARPLPTHRINARTHIHASSGIPTHDPSVRAALNRAATVVVNYAHGRFYFYLIMNQPLSQTLT